jgi:hypothetical protein
VTRRSSSCSIRAPRTHSRKWLRRSCTYDDSACCDKGADRGFNNIVTLCPYHITQLFLHLNCQMEPQLALPQRSPAMDNERDRHVAFAESTRWRTGYLHVLGPGELGQGEKGNDSAIRRPGREKCACLRTRSGTRTFAAPSDPRAGRAAGSGIAATATAAGSSWPAGAERKLSNGHGRAVNGRADRMHFQLISLVGFFLVLLRISSVNDNYHPPHFFPLSVFFSNSVSLSYLYAPFLSSDLDLRSTSPNSIPSSFSAFRMSKGEFGSPKGIREVSHL